MLCWKAAPVKHRQLIKKGETGVDLNLEELSGLLLKLWPLLLLQFSLMLWALVDLLRRRRSRSLSLPFWVIIIVLVNFLGPVAYFLFGRAET